MASSSSSHNYEVFLSFRGIDTRRNFTDHLYRALDRVGVRTFRDNEELKQGEEIGPELLKATKESKISIPVFSKNYASSKWCLKESAKIMDCRETDGQVVWSIFYKVEPSDVRKQSGSFAQAFLEHEETQSKETLDEWREALSKAGSLSGWDSEDPKNSYETNMIDSIVEKALNELNKNTLGINYTRAISKALPGLAFPCKKVTYSSFQQFHPIPDLGMTWVPRWLNLLWQMKQWKMPNN